MQLNMQLKTERLTVRPLQEADRELLRELLSDASVTIPAGFLPAETDEAYKDFWFHLKQEDAGCAILTKDNIIGYVSFVPYPQQAADPQLAGRSTVMSGFALGKPYHGKGYATEMLKAVTAYLKEHFDEVFVGHFTDNPASEHVIEKCGYRFYKEYSFFFSSLNCEKHLIDYIY